VPGPSRGRHAQVAIDQVVADARKLLALAQAEGRTADAQALKEIIATAVADRSGLEDLTGAELGALTRIRR
jgi:hypothetical protein